MYTDKVCLAIEKDLHLNVTIVRSFQNNFFMLNCINVCDARVQRAKYLFVKFVSFGLVLFCRILILDVSSRSTR